MRVLCYATNVIFAICLIFCVIDGNWPLVAANVMFFLLNGFYLIYEDNNEK
ncbi:hypothetical protein [Bacillus subtilis]|uniref:hypothetical protein n=1 Tax=Bacillus subtilis TaxID=1423 RepID=UPI002B4BFD05|nr:hypothetical protein [Bacillus subtilis]MEC0399907.1 hypothetical protein [Bacillus subtilis]MEC0429321.1 hypothetical protein [Bacillus subtilis]WRK89084.1 hypothetical protein U7118_07555 [Bacillus subtilis]